MLGAQESRKSVNGAVPWIRRLFQLLQRLSQQCFLGVCWFASADDEIDSSKMQAKMEFVPIDQLANYADKKVSGALFGGRWPERKCCWLCSVQDGSRGLSILWLMIKSVPNGPPSHLRLQFASLFMCLCWQMTVDVIGVVIQVAPLGSVKRKSDSVELSRRDMTIVDQR